MTVTNTQSGTNVHEVADGIYRINTSVKFEGTSGFSFNQYLIADDEPLLFHAGLETSSSFDQFAPSPDGQRFLIRRPLSGGGDRAPVHLLVNFELQRALAEAARQRPTQ